MSEQAPLLGLPERRAAPELDGAPDVVEERRGEEEVVAQARVELRRLAAERRDADRVLEQAARRSRGGRPRRRREARGTRPAAPSSARTSATTAARPGVRDLAGEEVEEAVELVGVAAHRRRQLRRVGVRCRLDRPHLHLEPAAEPLDASEHAHGVALGEAAVEQLDVVPDPRLDPPARVDELEREVRSAVLRPAPLLAADGVDALDGAVLGELGDAGHAASLGPGEDAATARDRYARAMADVAPFRAIRYAHPTAAVTAPPYDVLTPELRDALPRARPAQRRPPDPERLGGGGRPALPDVARGGRARPGRRAGRVGGRAGLRRPGRRRPTPRRASSPRCASSRTRRGTVLPHERTHAGPKESRLRLLRAARAQLEPIFLLYDGEPPVAVPDREPDLDDGGHEALAATGRRRSPRRSPTGSS